MTAAPSHQEREGAASSELGRKRDVALWSLEPIMRPRQGIDYEERADAYRLDALAAPDTKSVTIISGPISFRALAFWAVVIFAAGFFHGRQMSGLGSTTVESPTREIAPPVQSTPAAAAVPTQNNAATPARVTVRLLKFSPESIQVATGQTVEWANSDLTPHTVTSQGSGDLSSGSIDAGASWRHTFTQPGSFPYFCTFHPEMKGTVVVK